MFGEIREGDLSPRPAGQVDLGRHFVPIVTVLEGIRRRVSASTRVLWARGCDVVDPSRAGFAAAVEAAAQARVAIAAVGDRAGLVEGCTSGESVDRADLGLPGVQQELLEAIAATGTPLVVVLLNGRPLALPWIAQHAAAVIEAWLPGEEGGAAVADVLFGDVNPAGRLPISLPRSVGQVPVFYGHKPSGGRSQWKGDYADLSSRPLYCFGHGLSYTSFEYADLEIDAAAAGVDDVVRIGCTVRNAGPRAGEEVVQLYVHDAIASVTRPVMELRGFARVPLAAGESRRVTFELRVAQLAFHDRDMRLVVEPGSIEVLVGASSEDIRLRGGFEVAGGGPIERRIFSTRCIVD
jgi:beta-glucosidase